MGIRLPGHSAIKTSGAVSCKCGWSTNAATYRDRTAAYAEHLDIARQERERKCGDCGLVKDVKLMSVSKPGICKSCSTERTKRWAAENPNEWERHRRKSYLKNTYGITIEQYDEMLAAQGGVCAICGNAEADARLYKLHVDHCHSTGKVRGLLCGACNRGIGNLGDDIDKLKSAIRYLEKWC